MSESYKGKRPTSETVKKLSTLQKQSEKFLQKSNLKEFLKEGKKNNYYEQAE